MNRSLFAAGIVALLLTAAASAAEHDFTKMNVCTLVSGDAIARAFGGTLAETRPFNDESFSRCTYFVSLSGARVAFVVYLQPASDFEALRAATSDRTTTVSGIADAAYVVHDSGDGRFKVTAVKRGDMLFQATADSDAAARKLAKVVAGLLWAAK